MTYVLVLVWFTVNGGTSQSVEQPDKAACERAMAEFKAQRSFMGGGDAYCIPGYIN